MAMPDSLLPHGGGTSAVASVLRPQFDEQALLVRCETDGTLLCQELFLEGLAACIRALRVLRTPHGS